MFGFENKTDLLLPCWSILSSAGSRRYRLWPDRLHCLCSLSPLSLSLSLSLSSLSVSLSMWLSVSQSLTLSFCLSVCLSICLTFCLSVCLSLSIYIYIYLYIYIYIIMLSVAKRQRLLPSLDSCSPFISLL